MLHRLHSCFIQDYRPLEVDVSDNSPSDDTRLLVASLMPPEGITIRYWRNEGNIGPIGNQRKLFAAARGRRFVWMNDDDAMLPGAVSQLGAAYALAPDVIVTYGREELIDATGEVLRGRTEQSNREHERVPEQTGLRRDLLVCALLQQISHVGFLVLSEAARKVGVRDRLEVGLAVDADFAIRLGKIYRGSSHVFINRMTVQSRVVPASLSQTASDVAWKFYDAVSGVTDLSPEESRARDRLLTRIGPLALREHSLAHRRGAALRILLSQTFPHQRGLLTTAYSAGLIAMPRLAYAMRRSAIAKLGVRASTAMDSRPSSGAS